MTPEEFRDAVAPLGAVPWRFGKGLTRPIMRLYFAEFGHGDARLLATAVKAHLERCSEFPTVADLRHLLGLDRRPSLADGGSIFAELTEGDAPHYDPHRGGYWLTRDVYDRWGPHALAAFMAAGGSRAFSQRTDAGLPFLRRDFMRGWDDAMARLPADLPARPGLPAPGIASGLAPLADSLPRLLLAAQEQTDKPTEQGDAYEGDA
jgi:hypothetical protein